MIYKVSMALIFCALLTACSNEKPFDGANSSSMNHAGNRFTLTCGDFVNGSPIPMDCACERLGGKNRPPKLRWANAPEGTHRFGLIMQDETRDKGDKATKHWAVLNIPVSITDIQSLIDQAPPEVVEGVNYKKTSGYAGPCPPGKHHYTFTVFALNKQMPLISPGRGFTTSQFEREFKPFIIRSAAISGTYTPSRERLFLDKIKRKLGRILSKIF